MSILGKHTVVVGQVVLRGWFARRAPQALGLHLEKVIEWLTLAKANSPQGGVPAYFDLLRGRWTAPYPETTGYLVPTFLACSRRFARPDLRQVALALADYLLAARTPEGAVGHWKAMDQGNATPIVFDTGQVIFGWLAAWHESGNPVYLQAAEVAGSWLLDIQDASGAWTRHQHRDTVKVIDTRVAWALLQLAGATSRDAYIVGARRNLDWALEQQQANGWFRHASFLRDEDPFTHTIAYTAEGLLESGIWLSEPRYIEAAERLARAMLPLQRPDGWLASTYDAFWRPTARSSCLTGNCQMALLWLRLYGLARNGAYLDAARRAITFVASTQDIYEPNPNIRGAIAGSYPIYGRYARFQYPNWAAKFFTDALLALEKIETGG